MKLSADTQAGLEMFHEVSTSMIYLMGFSFILGSIFTLLLLVILDWIRNRNLAQSGE